MHRNLPHKGLVTDHDWTALADLKLAEVEGLSDRAAAKALHVSEATVSRWRKRRAAKKPIGEPRGDVKLALLSRLVKDTDAADGASDDELSARLNEFAERAKGDPFVWIAQAESLAAIYRGRALDRMAVAWEAAEVAARERAGALNEKRASYQPARVKSYPEPGLDAPATTRAAGGGRSG